MVAMWICHVEQSNVAAAQSNAAAEERHQNEVDRLTKKTNRYRDDLDKVRSDLNVVQLQHVAEEERNKSLAEVNCIVSGLRGKPSTGVDLVKFEF